MSKLDPRIEAVRVAYDLDASDFWQIPQNKQWVCKHAALEIVATKANVEWSTPTIIQADTAAGIAVMAVTGKMNGRAEWATGEASPKNNKNSYPWAMAEKRAKDRVVLKLVGIHGLVYSEDEMPGDEHRSADQRPEAGRREVANQSSPAWTEDMESLWKELCALSSPLGLRSFWADNSGRIAKMDRDIQSKFTKKKDEMKTSFERQKDEHLPGDTDITDASGRRLHSMEA